MNEATDVREMLDRFEKQNWNRHTPKAYDTIEELMEQVVEQGTFKPNAKVTANLSLTMRERVTGNREQDMTAMLLMGLMLGSALERDVPMDSDKEEQWRNGDFSLPE